MSAEMSKALNYLMKLAAAEAEEDSDSSGKKNKLPPRWQEFVDAQFQGGKKKVKNPRKPERGKPYQKQVSFSTAMKDKGFQKAVWKRYNRWESLNKKKASGGFFDDYHAALDAWKKWDFRALVRLGVLNRREARDAEKALNDEDSDTSWLGHLIDDRIRALQDLAYDAKEEWLRNRGTVTHGRMASQAGKRIMAGLDEARRALSTASQSNPKAKSLLQEVDSLRKKLKSLKL